MLYTTYLANMKNVPDDYIKLIITRFPPKWLDVNKHPNTYIIKELSPSKGLLMKYKKNNSWYQFAEGFLYEMHNRTDMIDTLIALEKMLNNDQDVCLICFEKDHVECHRSLIGQYFEQRGYRWKEIPNN